MDREYCKYSNGRIKILFGWWCIVLIILCVDDGASATTHQLWPYSEDVDQHHVQVFGNVRDGIRSQSISFAADPNGGSERFPRQLDTVHDHLMWREDHRPQQRAKTTLDSEYDRFINEHFRQPQKKNSHDESNTPETESEQMARDHERIQELAHYHRKSHPEKELSKLFAAGSGRQRPRKFKAKRPKKTTIQEDVEDYQPNDETIVVVGRYGEGTAVDDFDDDYQRIKQLAEQQAREEEVEDHPSQQRHCQSTQKDDMLCQTCLNPETGAKSESCSYASRPHSRKYAFSEANNYSRKRNGDGGGAVEGEDRDDDEDEDDPEIHMSQPLRKRHQSTMAGRPRVKREGKAAMKSVGRWRRRQRTRTEGDMPAEDKKETYEDFFANSFPEFPKYQTEDEDVVRKGNEHEDYELVARMTKSGTQQWRPEQPEDVMRALAEFRKRDWSDCKKTLRGELTCYECGDEQGVHHEQCMFVSEEWEDQEEDNNSGGQVEQPPRDVAASERVVVVTEQHPQQQDRAEFSELPKEGDYEWMGGWNNNVTGKGEDSRVASGKSTEGVSSSKKNKVKLNRKLVIKKRKLKQQQSDYVEDSHATPLVRDTSADEPKQEQEQQRPVKRRIRKKVTYRKTAKNVKHQQQKSEPEEPMESRRVMYFEQEVTQS